MAQGQPDQGQDDDTNKGTPYHFKAVPIIEFHRIHYFRKLFEVTTDATGHGLYHIRLEVIAQGDAEQSPQKCEDQFAIALFAREPMGPQVKQDSEGNKNKGQYRKDNP